jgi:hypothetical protein
MKPLCAALLAASLLLLPIATVSAQDVSPATADTPPGNSSPKVELPEGEDQPVNPFLPGEQLIGISVGLQIPAFLVEKTGGGVDNLDLGGSFGFSYQNFIARGFALGGNISGAFNGTIGGGSLFIAPLGLTAAYWWTKLPFEFSILGEFGAYLMRYDGKGILDPFAKAGVGAYWRISSGWSLGLQGYLWFVPEVHYGDYSYLSQYAGFVETSIAAVYHL